MTTVEALLTLLAAGIAGVALIALAQVLRRWVRAHRFGWRLYYWVTRRRGRTVLFERYRPPAPREPAPRAGET